MSNHVQLILEIFKSYVTSINNFSRSPYYSNDTITTYNSNVSRIIHLLEHVIDNDTMPPLIDIDISNNIREGRERNLDNFFRNSLLNNRITQPINRSNTSNFIRTIQYEPNDMFSTVCPISMENFENGEEISQIICCGHIFKKALLERWLRTNSICPVCRRNINPNTPSQPTTTQQRNPTTTLFTAYFDLSLNNIDNSYNNVDPFVISELVNNMFRLI